MSYCKMYDKKEDVDCVTCQSNNNNNNMPNDFCCFTKCGEHTFCAGCSKNTRKTNKKLFRNEVQDKMTSSEKKMLNFIKDYKRVYLAYHNECKDIHHNDLYFFFGTACQIIKEVEKELGIK